MKKLLGISILLLGMALPALAQWQQYHLSSDDQARFNSYFSRWQDYRRDNNREQVLSMEGRMLDIYSHYNIPSGTPFWRVASNAREGRGQYRLSESDQARFDSYFSRWQDYRQKRDRDQIRSMEGRMQDIYSHYNIPSGTPYFMVASNARDDDWDQWDRDRWRGRLSHSDQLRFNSYYSRWQGYRRERDGDQIRSMEGRMFAIYENYQIPRDVPFEQVANDER